MDRTETSRSSSEGNGVPFGKDVSDAVFRFVVVRGLFPLSDEGVHALVRSQEPVHAHDRFEREDARKQSHSR